MKGYIYIISQVDGTPDHRKSFYKVGISEDPNGRRKELQTGHPLLLRVKKKKKVENMHRAEKKVHKELKRYKAPGGTEWFYCTFNRAMKALKKI